MKYQIKRKFRLTMYVTLYGLTFLVIHLFSWEKRYLDENSELGFFYLLKKREEMQLNSEFKTKFCKEKKHLFN